VRVEQLRPGEGARLREVRLRALQADPDAFWAAYDDEVGFDDARWEQRLADPGRASFVGVDPDRPELGDVGIVGVGAGWADPAVAEIVSFWVDPRVRGRGLGSALLAAAEDWARAAGYPAVRMDVADGNAAAIALYARRSYAPTGATSTYPPPREHVTEHERVLRLT
jgi:ribosomal protein S18 acetylase RimI-like enzyme